MDEEDEVDTGTVSRDAWDGRVEFRNVNFSYGAGKDAVLSDVSIAVEPGRSLAIVGHSGSGKSTLVSLLPRFFDVDGGDILLDGVPIRDLSLQNLRDNISLVSQDVVLFNDTIANNLSYGQLRKHTEEEVLRAAEAAHVREFAEELPDGLETIVGDRGGSAVRWTTAANCDRQGFVKGCTGFDS